ncbi:AP-endonuclease/AP-lyase [Salinarchaeum sp. Harcht-Bsk1]|uniref:sugar phosphate isomerase/epimerase family protein n=1 Tax=Salinarchaeum sp. Harcht-Bsk1 TaxID=1333523 RepID=UPI00034245FA|nr:sugar phosphate isomerase/epimerase [Salinarchaeum sp. Harcht-Bsk1]AGN01241.1 AP-endonuclease/AP-lyase [Salinarchaeum sp. Harcht-Bsk1]
MQVGVLTVPLGGQSLDEALEYLTGLGVEMVELGCGGDPGDDHLPMDEYLDDEEAQAELQALLDEHGVGISALATHNNPLHPDEERAEAADEQLRNAIRLADQLDANTITCFSGLPAGGPNDEVPNWVTAPWPNEHLDALEYQWEEVAIPYWQDMAEFADDHGVDVAIEMHPNFLVYNPPSMLKLREATNERIGTNLDPANIVWQGIDVPEAIRYLGEEDAIHHVHAKDLRTYESNKDVTGALDTKPYTEEIDRSWIFRSIGYGHDMDYWKDLVSTLRMVGYDGTLSVEHEDSLTSAREGLEKAIGTLDEAIFETQPGEAYWVDSDV